MNNKIKIPNQNQIHQLKKRCLKYCKLSTVHCPPLTSNSGQILIALVLTLLTILTVGLIIIQRSTTDVTTSTQNDQSTRAFSAAEAGIEKALLSDLSGANYENQPNLTNNSAYTVTKSARLPLANQALMYPSKSKGDPAQFWLIRPDVDINSLTAAYDPVALQLYQKDGIYVYFGDQNAAPAAIEINLVTYNVTAKKIDSTKAYVDTNPGRADSTNFFKCETGNFNLMLNPPAINTSNNPNGTGSADATFKCRVRINTLFSPGGNILPIMIRTRFLYVDNQPVAVGPELTGCAPLTACTLPAQMTIYTSIGTSGQSRKTIQVIKEDNEVPYFFDYAIFSVGNIAKTN